MNLRSLKPLSDKRDAQTEELLVTHYQKFFQWATALTRGDAGKAEEIVQEFCLYLVLTKPDLRHVANLDGYLYISLRNLYQSSLARSTREAMRVVHVEEFDSIGIALSGRQGGDTLARQNDLRRICGYAVWRKDQSKNFCYFVLHFFHGYSRSEVAEMSGASLAAIYNKLHNARTEIKAYLGDSGRLRIIGKEEPAETVLLWHKIPESEFFRELREVILRARKSPCLPEEELLAAYSVSWAKPLSCELLSHLASCERCLDIVDGNFLRPTLRDRDPLDSVESHQREKQKQESATKRSTAHMLRTLHARLRETYEHRPRTLCIAVNGRIVAFHDIQGMRSILAARIDSPEKAKFIEVFSEQDIRLALLSISTAPPEGAHTITQRVYLSDERWLELDIVFDGLGLNSEVTYYDPVLGTLAETAISEEADEEAVPEMRISERASSLEAISDTTGHRFSDWIRRLIPSSVFAWALVLLVVSCTTGYFLYRHAGTPLSAQQILDRSMRLEAATLKGKTEYQTLRLEEVTAAGQIAQKGTIEVWKDGNGKRFLREVYNSRHQLIAAEWRVDEKPPHSYKRKDNDDLAKIPWTQDVSAHAFARLSEQPPQMQQVANGYRLTVEGPVQSEPHLVSATLVLTGRFIPVQEIFRLRNRNGVYKVRLVQMKVSYTPSDSVPNRVFEPYSVANTHGRFTASLTQGGSAEQLATLDIAVLYQLSQMDADTGVPIAVHPTADGHLQIIGSIADPMLRNHLLARLRTLPNHRLLDIDLAASNHAGWAGLQSLHSSSGPLHVYETGGGKPLADALVRNHFTQQGLSGKQLDSSVAHFSSGVLTLSQQALQNAYALDRLGMAISISGANTLDAHSLVQWTEMVTKHASLLETELRSLHRQLNSILPPHLPESQMEESSKPLNNTGQFAEASGQLLHQVQEANGNIDRTFASQGVGGKNLNGAFMITSTARMLPIREASEIETLAKHLSQAEAVIKAAEGASNTTGHSIQR